MSEPPKPFLLHLAKCDDYDRWRIGFDLGDMIFFQDVLYKQPSDLAVAMAKAASQAEYHLSLPEEEQAARITAANLRLSSA